VYGRPERPTLPALLALEPNVGCWRDRWMMRLAMVKVAARVPLNTKEEADIDDWLFRGKLPSGYGNILRLTAFLELTVVKMERSDGRFSCHAESPPARLRWKTERLSLTGATTCGKIALVASGIMSMHLVSGDDTWSILGFMQEGTIKS